MWFKNKIENAYYELIAPEKQELFSESNKLEKKSIKNSPIDLAINNLDEKIKQSRTGKERYILEKQIEQLRKLQKLYKEYIKINITNNTKKEINKVFSSIKNQITLTNNNLPNDYKIINSKLEQEKQQLKDTIDIFSYWTIRDLVEDNINILWIRESISPEKYQDFFDIATIEYINILETRIKRKLNKNDIKSILKQEWLILTQKEINIFSQNINKKLTKNYNFKYKVKLYNDDLIELNAKKEEAKTKDININQLFKETTIPKTKTNILKNKINTEIKKVKLDNYEKLSTSEKMKDIEKIINNPKNEKFLLAVINKLENKVISVDHKKIKLTKEFINKHKIELLNNLKAIILMIIHIESDWNYKAKNTQKSSWKWLWQWLDWNWHFNEEYYYKGKWYTKDKINKINIKKLRKRNAWHTSSFETSLKNIYFNYPNKLLNKLNFNIPTNYNKKLDINPLDFTLEQQIQLLILDIWSNTKKVKNRLWQEVWIKDYIWTALLWNTWAVKEIYKIFHHTKPDKKTLNRIREISPKYTKRLVKLYN